MNTHEISNAQLSVSSHYTPHTISKLIDKLYMDKLIAYYNAETKSIDVEPCPDTDIYSNIVIIKETLKNWIDDLPIDIDTAIIVKNNIDFIFNITQVYSDNGIIIKLYLF